jgi:hypothetical protein
MVVDDAQPRITRCMDVGSVNGAVFMVQAFALAIIGHENLEPSTFQIYIGTSRTLKIRVSILGGALRHVETTMAVCIIETTQINLTVCGEGKSRKQYIS